MVVVAARYNMPRPGFLVPENLAASDEQIPVPLGDVYNGEPGKSSLKWEGQGVCTRPGTDVYVSGHAWAPRGKKVGQVPVSVRVGTCQRIAVVFGDRRWNYGLIGRRFSAPVPFEKIPLIYERCFGGFIEGTRGKKAEAIDRNPVGRGIYTQPKDQLLPNIEDPNHLISGPKQMPLPQGFGPIARGWTPRRSLAGTYDQTWINRRAPLWPLDLDPRFFLAASPGLYAVPYLRGGEEVTLIGVHPDGPIRFRLPQPRLVAKFRLVDRVERHAPVIDAVMLEPDSLNVTLILRTSVVACPTMLAVQTTSLRLLEDWEELPP